MLAFLVFFPMISAVISYIIGKKSKTASIGGYDCICMVYYNSAF